MNITEWIEKRLIGENYEIFNYFTVFGCQYNIINIINIPLFLKNFVKKKKSKERSGRSAKMVAMIPMESNQKLIFTIMNFFPGNGYNLDFLRSKHYDLPKYSTSKWRNI